MNDERNKMPTITTIKANRKASKPMMEKRRRARINQSLSELKDLVVCSSKYEINNCRRSKLEKADILEMTVRHLHHLHHLAKNDKDQLPVENNVDNLEKFRAGFHECVNEVNRYLNEKQLKLDGKCRNGLTIHLNTKLNHLSSDQQDTIRPTNNNKHRGSIKDKSNSSKDQNKQHPLQYGYQCQTEGLSCLNPNDISPKNECAQLQQEKSHRNSNFKPEIEIPQIAGQRPEIEHSVWRPW